MSDELKNAGSASDQAGSSANVYGDPNITNPNNIGGAGQSPNGSVKNEVNLDQFVSKDQYKELEKKLGEQGQELGDYRAFFEGIAPLLDKLDASPDLVRAITAGALTPELAVAAMDGKITLQDAKTVTQAHDEVKKEMGKEKYEQSNPDDIKKLVEEKVTEMKSEVTQSIKEIEEMRDFEGRVNDFISRTPDFAEFAEDIDKWLDAHPNIFDIEVAYFAVKGIAAEKLRSEGKEAEAGEVAKQMAANAAGGHSQNSQIPENEDVVDSLIAGRTNPNVF
jgi:hypothetical protein